MEIIKLLKDYSKTPLEKELGEYFSANLDSSLCCEKIKNKNYIIQYLKPLNDFVIYTNALPCAKVRRLL